MILALTTIAVVVVDQALKLLLRRGEFQTVRLGPYASLGVVEGRLWVDRFGGHSPKVSWLWAFSAAGLVVASVLMPASGIFVGLMLGGSLSNAVEVSRRGSVTDYVCIRFWPAFNLADVALTVGAIGIAAELLRAINGSTG